MKIKVELPITLPDNWANEVIERLRKDGTLVPLIHAHWINCKVGHEINSLKCSNCEKTNVMNFKTKFCPDCGAQMNEEEL